MATPTFKDIQDASDFYKRELVKRGERSLSYGTQDTPTPWYNQFFEKEIELTAADYTCENALRVGSVRSSLMVVLIASHCNGDTPVKVAAGDTITISLQQSDQQDGTFDDVGPSFCVTAPADGIEANADCKLLDVNLGNMTKPWAKVKIKGTATGKIDVALGLELHG